MISFLNRHESAAFLVMALLLFAARVCGVDSLILQTARQLQASRQIEYALGFIGWFLLFTLGFKVPKYNIYQLIPANEKDRYLDLLHRRLHEYLVEKQYYLLQSQGEIGEDFTSRIKDRLATTLRAPRKSTAFKTRKFDTTSAFEALCRIDDILKGAGLHPFLVSGTLLGAVRDNKLIEGDNDLDIGIMADESTGESVFKLLVENPAFLSVYNLGHLVQVTDKNSTVIDIFMHYREGEYVWHGTNVHKWTNTRFELTQMCFNSHTFLVPDSPQRYLDENYGNWQRPVLFWDYAFDTPNHQFFTNKKAIYYLTDRIVGELGKAAPSRHTIQTAMDILNEQFAIDITHHIGSRDAHVAPKKETVVITFGTFDLFHIGHLNILQRASAYGDRLVVGVSSDALNFSKKATYPVYCQEDRLKIVNSMEYVSEAFFEESLELKAEYIKKYNADILVMGNDWEGKFDHLSDICEVVYLARTSNISTSETKDAIKRNL